jgi:hypothetical protein
MCGRYAVTSAPKAIRALFGYPEQPNFPPRYNVAPTQPIAIVRLMDGKRQFALVRWGLLPSWVKDPKDFTLVINARGESVLDKPAFSAARSGGAASYQPTDFTSGRQSGQANNRITYGEITAGICRGVGILDWPQWRRDGNGGNRDDAGQSYACRHP